MKRRLAGVAVLGVAVWVLVQVVGSVFGPHVTATLHVGGLLSDAAVDQTGNLWVIGRDSGTLSRIGAATGMVEEDVPLSVEGGSDPVSIAVGEGSLWVGANGPCDTRQAASGCLLRIDPGSGRQLAAIPIGAGPAFIAIRGCHTWQSPGSRLAGVRDLRRLMNVGRTDPEPGVPPSLGVLRLWRTSGDPRQPPAGSTVRPPAGIAGPLPRLRPAFPLFDGDGLDGRTRDLEGTEGPRGHHHPTPQ